VKNVVLQSLSHGVADAKRLADALNVPNHLINVHRFPDGELRVTVGPASDTTLLYVPLDQPNEKLITLLFAVEALRRGGAQRIVLVAPYLCYMRQDTAFHAGEAISQKGMGQLIAGIVDRVVTVDAHLHRTRDIRTVFPGIEAQDISATPAMAAALHGVNSSTVVVGPDEEWGPWVCDLAGQRDVAYAVGRKTRDGDRSVQITFSDPRTFAGRPVLLVDDIVSSGGTLAVCAQTVIAAGASSVDAVVTHALFPMTMMDNFKRSGIRSVKSTTSVPHPTNAIALDDVLAAALRQEIAT
jgi:ribose-phosphate pyrophosphokinase